MSIFLSAAENAARSNVKTFDVIFKKMREKSTRTVELAVEGHTLFISAPKYNFKP